MIKPEPKMYWPESWKASFEYDLREVYDVTDWPGYTNAYRQRQQRTLAMVRRAVQPGGRILDVAAAQGNFTLLLAEEGYHMVWNDLRTELADYVRLKHEHGSVCYHPGNAFELETAVFDAVLITEIIEHVAHPDAFLRRIAAMVKPGGHVIMTTPNGAHLLNRLPKFSDCPDPSVFEDRQFQPNGDGHVFLLWREEITHMAETAGLEVLSHETFTTPLASGLYRTEWLFRLLTQTWPATIERMAERLPVSIRDRIMIHSATLMRRQDARPR